MALSGLMSKVTFVNKVPLLMKATSADPTLPAGHIYDEISNITFESLAHSDVLVEFLIDRLKKTSPLVKLKVLLIMKHVVQKGQKEFRQLLSKQSQGVREAKSFSGPPDPLHGDAPYVKIREAAGELLQLLFDTNWNELDSKSQQINKPMRRMEGFGNTAPSDADRGILGNAMQHVKESFAYGLKENVRAINSYHERDQNLSGGYQQLVNNEKKIINRPSQTLNLLQDFSTTAKGADAERPAGGNPSSRNAPATEWRNDIQMPKMDNFESNETELPQSWSQESVLVEKITTPGGVRLAPGKTELQDFIKKCESLNFSKIVELIEGKLQSSDYRVQMKSLFLIESLINSRIPNACEQIVAVSSTSLESLCQSTQSVVKNKSRKLAQILKIREADPTSTEATQSEKGNIPMSADFLLDLSAEPSGKEAERFLLPENIVNGSKNEDLMALVGGLSVQDQEHVSANTKGNSQVTGLKSQEAPSTTLNTLPESSSLDFLDFDNFGGPASMPNIASDISTSSQRIGVTNSDTLPNRGIIPDSNLDTIFDPFSLPVAASSSSKGSHLESEVDLDPFSTARTNSNPVTPMASKSSFDFLSQNDPAGAALGCFDVNSQSQTTTTNQHAFAGHWGLVDSAPQYSSHTMSSSTNPPQGQNVRGNGMLYNTMRTQPNLVQGTGMAAVPNRMSQNVTRGKASNSNGFEFIGGSKKAGAFDFVKEAMEASKRK